jgi:hypothetical protein
MIHDSKSLLTLRVVEYFDPTKFISCYVYQASIMLAVDMSVEGTDGVGEMLSKFTCGKLKQREKLRELLSNALSIFTCTGQDTFPKWRPLMCSCDRTRIVPSRSVHCTVVFV